MNKPLSPDELARALDYPYSIPATHFAFDAATCETELRPGLTLIGARAAGEYAGARLYDIDISDGGGAVETLSSVCAVVASGSNASPEQMTRKFRGVSRHKFISVLCEFRGLVPVYSAHFARYGAIAATLIDYVGASSQLVMSFFQKVELDLMHATESLGVQYDFKSAPSGALALPSLGNVQVYYYASRSPPVKTCEEEAILLSGFDVKKCPLRRATERQLLTRAIAQLFPDQNFIDALTAIVRSNDNRLQAMARLKSIRIDLDEPVYRPAN